MGRTCRLHKTCSICGINKYNLEFYSNKKGRTSIKPFCKACKHIYHGIKQNLIDPEKYVGKNLDIDALKGEDNQMVIKLNRDGTFEKLTVSIAKEFIKQGGGYITSSCTIESYGWGDISSEIDIKLKDDIYIRDQRMCHYCGDEATTLDHVIPRFKGGLNTPLNLVCACVACNSTKGHLSKQTFLRKRKLGIISDKKIQKIKDKMEQRKQGKHRVTPVEKKETPVNKPVKAKTKGEKLKYCHICNVHKATHKFAQGGKLCRKCNKLEAMFHLGWITREKIASITTDSSNLKGPWITMEYSDGLTEDVPRKQAKKYAKAGIVEIIHKTHMKALIPDDKIEKLHPGLLQRTIKPRKEPDEVTHEDKNKNNIMIKSPEGTVVGAVPPDKKEEVEKLVSLDLATFADDFEARLKDTPQRIMINYPMLNWHRMFFKGVVKKIPRKRRYV